MAGSCLATYLLMISALWHPEDSLLTLSITALVTIELTLLLMRALDPTITLLASTRIGQNILTLLLSLMLGFFSLYIGRLVINYSLGYWHIDLSSEVVHLYYHALLPVFAISLGLNLIGFIIAYFFTTDKLTDLSYALTFAGTTLLLYVRGVRKISFNHRLGTLAMILLWAFRLGTFLFKRILKQKKDGRFDKMRANFLRFGGFWLLQGLSVPIILMPITIFLTVVEQDNGFVYPIVGYIGAVIALFGLLIEHLADQQKYAFKQEVLNKNKWIMHGLWHYSRHPNYLGEMTFWIGIYIAVFPYFTTFQAIIAALSPLYITFLLSFVSGIPILEYRADERWGDQKAYQAYKKKTSILIPFL